MTGRFITLEGIDGAGKSTHLGFLAKLVAEQGSPVRTTREPGGTVLGERLRELLLDSGTACTPDTEALLMFAARRQHLTEVIVPALAAGEWVICDRFTDATFAYQGWGRGVDLARLEALEHWVHAGLQPDLTLFFDVPVELARDRLAGARAPDRFELEQMEFFRKVRQGYLDRAARFAQRIRIIDGRQSVENIRAELRQAVQHLQPTQ
jgi:dTMP kinase